LHQKIKGFDNASSNGPEKVQPIEHHNELYRTRVDQAIEAILVIQNNWITRRHDMTC
jgi:hypothetical protein